MDSVTWRDMGVTSVTEGVTERRDIRVTLGHGVTPDDVTCHAVRRTSDWMDVGFGMEMKVVPWVEYGDDSTPWVKFRVRKVNSINKGYVISWDIKNRRPARDWSSLRYVPAGAY